MKISATFFLLLIYFAAISQSTQKLIINFDYNKYDLTLQAQQKLDSFLQSNQSVLIQKINLYGHCDFIGNNKYNDELSIKRVSTTKDYLIAHNIAANVFDTIKGFGKRAPLNANSNAEEKFLNRRVEILFEKNEISKTQEIKTTAENKPVETLAEKLKDTGTKTGSNIILKNINFIGGRHFLMQQSVPALTELLNALKENPTLEIELQGHICCEFGNTDGVDFDTNTRNLSINRARAIYDYLISQGIAANRLSYKGFGHSRPLFYPEDTDEKQTANRRVEIKIIKK